MTIKRSNRGVQIDFDALMAKAGESTAVGNMRVNAQGDVLGRGGEIVQKNEERVRAYYKNNPRSSTSASLKGETPTQKLQPDTVTSAVPKTAATAKENVRTAKPTPDPVVEPDEFDAPNEPIGYREVELPNGDIEMVPIYKSGDE
jgi:hypothetical protein